MNRIALLTIAFLVVSCAPQQPDVNEIKSTIEAYNKVLAESMIAGDNETIMGYYDEGAISMPSNGPMLKGKDAIRKHMEEMSEMGMKITSATFTMTEVDAGGNYAYEIGTYEMAFDMGAMGAGDDDGKYMSVWKKQTDGSWKVYAEIWNSSRELPMAQ